MGVVLEGTGVTVEEEEEAHATIGNGAPARGDVMPFPLATEAAAVCLGVEVSGEVSGEVNGRIEDETSVVAVVEADDEDSGAAERVVEGGTLVGVECDCMGVSNVVTLFAVGSSIPSREAVVEADGRPLFLSMVLG